jgi:hypothetical protein
MKEELKPLFKAEDNWFTEEEPTAEPIDWTRIDLSLRGLQIIHAHIPTFVEIPFRNIGRFPVKTK